MSWALNFALENNLKLQEDRKSLSFLIHVKINEGEQK